MTTDTLSRTDQLKTGAKVELQEALGWVDESRTPIICIPSGIRTASDGDLLTELLPGLLTLTVQIAILGKGGKEYGEMLTTLSRKMPHKLAIIGSDQESRRAMLAGADIALFLAESLDARELTEAMVQGTVPVAIAHSLLMNYNPNQESGNSFTFEQPNVWSAFAACVRACETYRFPFDWKTIQKHCMGSAR